MGSPVFVKKWCDWRLWRSRKPFVFSSFAGVAVLGGTIFANHFHGQKYRLLSPVYRPD
jgi:hypothetical protein